MKSPRLLAATAILALSVSPVLTGCQPSEPPAPSSGTGGGPGGPGGGGALTDNSSGADIYKAKCRGCHGGDGHGGSGPSLVGEAGHSVEELSKVISDGDGKMPAFKGQLTAAQITKVAEHVKTIK